jgi:hypothetical protein
VSDEIILGDRAVETTDTQGTITYVLKGAIPTSLEFGKLVTIATAVGDGRRTYYCAFQDEDFEIGIGRVHKGVGSAADTLERLVIKRSSRPGNAAVPWGAGTRTIFTTTPAGSILLVDNALSELAVAGDTALGNLGATALGLALVKAASAAAARASLGLGSAAVLDVGTTALKIVQLDAAGKLPALDGSQLLALPKPAALVASYTGGANNKVVRYSSSGVVTVASRGDAPDLLTHLLVRGSDGVLYGRGLVPFAGVVAGGLYYLSTSGDLTTTVPTPQSFPVITQVDIGRGMANNVLYFDPRPPVSGVGGFGGEVPLYLEAGTLRVQ